MTIRFKNDIINRRRSDFRGGKKGVYTSFKFRKDTRYKGLYLCEYPNGDKHFIIKYYLSGHRKKKKIFAIGKFNQSIFNKLVQSHRLLINHPQTHFP